MANATHTKGPWHMFSNSIGCGVTAVDIDVAHCHGFDTSRSRQEEEANATLIAAAPDLLAALELAEDALSRSPFSTQIWPNDVHPQTGISQIRAAIHLAKPASTNEEAE